MSKSCNNCIYLDYYQEESYESSDESGFVCNGRDLYGEQESKHIANMQREEYRSKGKKCCELSLEQSLDQAFAKLME